MVGLTPEQLLSTFFLIRESLATGDARPLTPLMVFPVHQCGRCPGDVIETPEEFTDRYLEIVDEATRQGLIALRPEDIFISWRGARLMTWEAPTSPPQVGFEGYCETPRCETSRVYIQFLAGYCSSTPPFVPFGGWSVSTPSPQPTFDPSNFTLGAYAVVSHEQVEASSMTEETLANYVRAQMYVGFAQYNTSPPSYFGPPCTQVVLEFCPPNESRGSASWYGIPASGRLLVVCRGDVIHSFDIFEGGRLGSFEDGYYFILELVSTLQP
jgi:hypothetical protein